MNTPRHKNAAFIAALLCSLPAVPAQLQPEVPSRFLGHWGGSPAGCADPGADDLVLRISAKQFQFWESDGRVLAVATDGELELAVLLEFSSESETWLEAKQFRLSNDRQSLTDVTGRKKVSARIRCRTPNE